MDILEFLAENAAAITTIAATVIGLVITYIKKKLSNDQGDVFVTQFESWATQVASLATALSGFIPELATISKELTECVASAKKLWEDPENNTEELTALTTHGSELFATAMALVEKYFKSKVSGDTTGAA